MSSQGDCPRDFGVKLLNQPITVKSGSDGMPLFFTWENSNFKVDEVIDLWKDTGKWWEGEEEKIFYRVLSGKRAFELYREAESSRWCLYKIYD